MKSARRYLDHRPFVRFQQRGEIGVTCSVYQCHCFSPSLSHLVHHHSHTNSPTPRPPSKQSRCEEVNHQSLHPQSFPPSPLVMLNLHSPLRPLRAPKANRRGREVQPQPYSRGGRVGRVTPGLLRAASWGFLRTSLRGGRLRTRSPRSHQPHCLTATTRDLVGWRTIRAGLAERVAYTPHRTLDQRTNTLSPLDSGDRCVL